MQVNESGIQPAGHCVLIKPYVVEETTSSGIIIHTGDRKQKEEMAQTYGTVVAIGPTAYQDQAIPWCEVGNHVIFAKFAGQYVPGTDGITYRLVNDLDIKAVLTEKKEVI